MVLLMIFRNYGRPIALEFVFRLPNKRGIRATKLRNRVENSINH